MIDFYSIFDLAQIKAIGNALSPNIESIYRMKCRQYSEKFHTPLHVVQKELDPFMVLEALYEEQYHPSIVEEEIGELNDILQKIKDPTYSKYDPQLMEEFVDMVLNKEIKRASQKKDITQETIREEITKEKARPIPKSGSLNFGDLEKLDSMSESNKANFED